MRDAELEEIADQVAELLCKCLAADVGRDEAVAAVGLVLEFFEERAGVEPWRFAQALAKATSSRGGKA